MIDKLHKRLQERVKAMLHETMRAPERQIAEDIVERSVQEFEARCLKAGECPAKEREIMLTPFLISQLVTGYICVPTTRSSWHSPP